MKRRLTLYLIFVLLLLVLWACGKQQSKDESKTIEDSFIKDAIKYGKDRVSVIDDLTYSISPKSCTEKSQPYCEYEKEILYLDTPFITIANIAKEKAKSNEEPTDLQINSIISQDNLIISVYALGNSENEVRNAEGIIKHDDKVLSAEKVTMYPVAYKCDGSLCNYEMYSVFIFEKWSLLVDKKIRFVLIRENGEKEYEIDMPKYR